MYRGHRLVRTRHRKRIRRLLYCQPSKGSRRYVRFHFKRYKRAHHRRRLWHYYRTHPMPACTWVGESGGNYRARNPSSTAGGKYQILASTWYANGGSHYPDSHPAAVAPPLEQEKIARRVLQSQGLGAWVLC